MMTQREIFEAWAKDNELDIKVTNFNQDTYTSMMTDWAWIGWQAAIDAPKPPKASAVPEEWKVTLRKVTDCLATAIIGGKVTAYMAAEAIKNAESLLAAPQPKVQP